MAAAAPNLQVVKTFREIYEEEFDFVWRVLRRMGLDERASEDAAQEVFLRFHRKMDEWDRTRPVRALLGGYAWNVASEMRKRASARYEKPAGEELPDRGDEGDARLDGRIDAKRLLQRALSRLTEDQYLVVTLHLLEDRPMPEVSRMLQVNEETLRSRLRAARQVFEPELLRHLRGNK